MFCSHHGGSLGQRSPPLQQPEKGEGGLRKEREEEDDDRWDGGGHYVLIFIK